MSKTDVTLAQVGTETARSLGAVLKYGDKDESKIYAVDLTRRILSVSGGMKPRRPAKINLLGLLGSKSRLNDFYMHFICATVGFDLDRHGCLLLFFYFHCCPQLGASGTRIVN